MTPAVREDGVSHVEVEARPIETPGRVYVRTDNRRFILDEPQLSGGPGEELGVADTFLGSVAACAVGMIDIEAADRGIDFDELESTARATVDTNKEPVREDRFVFHTLTVSLRFAGIDGDDAAELVAYFEQNCPIYGTISTAIPDSTVEFTVD